MNHVKRFTLHFLFVYLTVLVTAHVRWDQTTGYFINSELGSFSNKVVINYVSHFSVLDVTREINSH